MKHITMDNWEGSFDKFVEVGDTVSKEIVDYFTDVMPPASMGFGYLQVGEPYSHNVDKRNGKWRPTFPTFAMNREGQWVYCGNCFHRETVPAEKFI